MFPDDATMQTYLRAWLSEGDYDLLNAVLQQSAHDHDMEMLERGSVLYADTAATIDNLRRKLFGPYIEEVG